MASFKQWLITEDITDDPDAFGDLFYPTTAGDYAYVSSDPTEHWWLQWKWTNEKDLGRSFHNIDAEEFEKRDYVAIQSNDMPAASGSGWKHRRERHAPLSVRRHYDLGQKKIAKHGADKTSFLGNNHGMKGYYLPLDQIFGDKPSGQWPEQAANTRWRR